ncbi:ATP synthase F1 subunit gamma [Candidatus Uhrbacteria bacterium]|nr:ATP synthase F1 subunit gamma [Candidatus Uhrbacteria bacterium]
MAVSPRLIRRRIKSVTNTRKITKAMELVAASKMRKAVSAVLASRPYAAAAWRAVGELAKVTESKHHPLLARRDKIKRVLVVLFTSDRGLCGGFNAQLLKATADFMKGVPHEVDFVTVGRKGQDALRRQGAKIVATFTDLGNNPKSTDIRPIADLATSDFVAGAYDRVFIATTDFRSALVQKPVVQELLPLIRVAGIGKVDGQPEMSGGEDLHVAESGHEFVFEPSPAAVLDRMLPRLVEVRLYQALLESSASEHSARMLAMRSASDAAADMIDDLTFTFNQARQAGITREIAEISSGKAALE